MQVSRALQGTARGGIPSARIAAYKVCGEGCRDADILADFDDAIADGVDITTISIGSTKAINMRYDGIAIGSLHAMQKGILTVHSAGNGGIFPGSVISVAPWLFTIGASSIDRGIVTRVSLGNGKTIVGKAVNPFKMNGTEFPLVYGKDVTSECNETQARFCSAGCLDRKLVNGKIVLCDSNNGVKVALSAGAAGTIVKSRVAYDVSFVVPLPASALLIDDLKLVKDYINSTNAARAFISTSESIKNTNAPLVASFSSKGPNPIISDILKPDITAPGVEILAAYSPVGSASSFVPDKGSANYSILSGTSMSCPHAAGAAAYVKSVHPDWSPSAIKSAIMTTAWPMDPTKHKEEEFSYGAGHLNPINATNPGLVYETNEQDYIKLLCNIGYTIESIRKLFNNNNINCTGRVDATINDFNYPSISLKVKRINKPANFNITVEPGTLSFKQLNEKKSFVVTVKGDRITSMISASLVWSDGIHSVRSPIVYVVYMGSLPQGDYSTHESNKLQEQHIKMLQEVVDGSFLSHALVRSYKRSFNGFAASLTNQEQQRLASFSDVVSIFPSRTLWPQTTRSWDYMGLKENVKPNPDTGSDIVIGVLDSGIWPESESFSDKGFGPIPAKWKGVCNGGKNFTCNKKLVGARFYSTSVTDGSARDLNGHGTHTASTAAGNYVRNASFYGIAQGTARGGIPSARIAAYKVCGEGCRDLDILAAFDDAIADGVDIITISIGSSIAINMRYDSIAIGSLHATQKGILTVHSAGNDGFFPGSVVSVAPWLFTIGASSIDRGIVTKVSLGNGKKQ
ncbi:UNVERIFIED_CONTAM: Subtilisin-like protease SBT4.3 [Sesamum latifolium]|uniref:Subtilisin-like protease SBT4.3 n=1 Tax=Sesamum latifolium TaxID=2727402 RepID=A0AAW2UWM9_9LAMI